MELSKIVKYLNVLPDLFIKNQNRHLNQPESFLSQYINKISYQKGYD